MKNFWKILAGLVAVGAIFLALAVVLFFKTPEEQNMQVFFSKSQAVFDVEIASTPMEQMRGLMWRQSLSENSGMLFVFSRSEIQSFWMKNTLIPLDLVFIGDNGKVVDIKNDFLPCEKDPCDVYSSISPAKYVLEINSGQASKRKIEIGEVMTIK
ncbi:MAG: DUF192 domain-containing protein [Patescibacteria group bacterium]|jgi:hypothetical protein